MIITMAFFGGAAAYWAALRATRSAPADSLRGRFYTIASGGGPGPVIRT